MDLQTSNPEKYFLDLMLNELKVKIHRSWSNANENPYTANYFSGDPLTLILNKMGNIIASETMRGFATIGIVNSKLESRVEPIINKAGLCGKALIVNDDVPENMIILLYKGLSERDGPFFIGRDDKAFAHPDWKNYVRVLELT